MRLPLFVAIATMALPASPAMAQDRGGYDRPYDNASGYLDAPYSGGYYSDRTGYDPREAWLADCRHRLSARDSGVGGALVGGAVGGLAGNRIAGRGNRAVGTIAGTTVGAAAGAVIDKAEDSGRNRDECEAYLDDYYARYQAGSYAPQGYYPAYGYAYPAQAWAPPASREQDCTETVEYVYEDVPVRPARRVIPRRSKAVRDKRIPIK